MWVWPWLCRSGSTLRIRSKSCNNSENKGRQPVCNSRNEHPCWGMFAHADMTLLRQRWWTLPFRNIPKELRVDDSGGHSVIQGQLARLVSKKTLSIDYLTQCGTHGTSLLINSEWKHLLHFFFKRHSECLVFLIIYSSCKSISEGQFPSGCSH